VIMCGVRFMAETVKTLAPEKHVYLPVPSAGCPMAEQLTREDVLELKEKYPEYEVCAYINTTADLAEEILRMVGYDGCVSIEHEDSLMSANEGLMKAIAMLKDVMMFENFGGMWWA